MAKAYQPYRTSEDLVLRVLRKLGVLASGQTVAPEDFSLVADELDSIFRTLAGLELVYVADPTQLPGEWFGDLASIVAGELAADFGASDATTLKQLGLGAPAGSGAAALSLKVMTRGRPTYETMRTESF